MLDRLRRRLTLLYTVAAVTVLTVISGGVFIVVERYFERITDQALQHKIVDAFRSLAAPLPADLAAVSAVETPPTPLIDAAAAARAAILAAGGRLAEIALQGDGNYLIVLDDGRRVIVDGADANVLSIDTATPSAGSDTAAPAIPPAFEAELAAVYLLPLAADGSIVFNPNELGEPPAADLAALAAALADGSDLRTITTASGQRVRLLTYRLTRSDGPAALQAGRVLGDQSAVLRQLVGGLIGLGSVGIAVVGALSWWIAGRAILPTQLAWQRQQRFIAGASHELRTPLTLIRASADVARRPSRNDQARLELLDDIMRETDHMRRLVDDLLMLTRLDSNALPLQRQLLELAPWLADFARQVALMSEQHRITVESCPADLLLDVDADRLRQILLILLDNALRHTPPGGEVNVAVQRSARMATFTVRDTGSGIAPEHLPHVFDPFYRADDARHHSSNAGLGLSIAQALVQAHGGTISIAAAVGSGTIVTFTLPTARAV